MSLLHVLTYKPLFNAQEERYFVIFLDKCIYGRIFSGLYHNCKIFAA